MRKFIFSLLILATCYFILTTKTIFAQNNFGIEVTPSLINLDLSKDAAQTQITYFNRTNQTILLSFSASNITELEAGSGSIYLEDVDKQNARFGLASSINFSSTSLILPPESQNSITIFINKKQLSTGGHYGSILAQVNNYDHSSNVAINEVLSTLIFVTTNHGVNYESGNILTLSPENNFFSFPENFLLRFENTGENYLIPYGRLNIYDEFGKLVGAGILNEGSLMVVPQSIRRFEIPINQKVSFLFPGIYHTQFTLHAGEKPLTFNTNVSFFTFGSIPLIPIVLIVIVLIIAYLFYRKRR